MKWPMGALNFRPNAEAPWRTHSCVPRSQSCERLAALTIFSRDRTLAATKGQP